MAEKMNFSVQDAVLDNLERLSREYSIISDQRLLELWDIAIPMVKISLELFDEGLDSYDVLSVVSEVLSFGEYRVSEYTTPEHRDLISRGTRVLARSDRALFTDLYLRGLSEARRPFDEGDFLIEGSSSEMFTYVRNSLSDEAYDVFSQEFSDPRVRYSDSFKDAARLLSSGEVDFCLFPLEEKGGARLPTVAELIFRNDFKINAVTPVFGPDGNADMKYALVSRSFSVPKRKADDDIYLELRLGADVDTALSELLSASDHFGMTLYRVNTVNFDTEGESETYFSVVIKDGGTGFAPLLVYLALFVRDFVPVGIYKNLE